MTFSFDYIDNSSRHPKSDWRQKAEKLTQEIIAAIEITPQPYRQVL